MKRFGWWMLAALVAVPSLCRAETVQLRAIADIWLSDANPEERNSSAGLCPRIKLKSIQELGAFRFDVSSIRGREVLKVTLYLRRASEDKLRYIRVSTVASDWVEGQTKEQYGPASGSTWLWADADSRRPWAWRGSQFVDVIMGNSHTLTHWTECRKLDDGWIAVDLMPELVYALVAGDSDGLAVMEGGTLALTNNFIHSCQSKGSEPYIEVELGRPLKVVPPKPAVKAQPAIERASLDGGAIQVSIEPAKEVFCWKLTLNGQPVERWRVKRPQPKGMTCFCLKGLKPREKHILEVVAVSPTGQTSQPAKVEVTASPALAGDLALGAFQRPQAKAEKLPQVQSMRVWVAPPVVKVDPIDGAAMFDDAGDREDYRRANAVWDGRTIRLAGARGEYVSYQVVIENLAEEPLAHVMVAPQELRGPEGATIGGKDIELYRNWYARNKDNKWQPAYCVPLKADETLRIPDPARKLEGQKNQSVYVDLYIPKDAKPGKYEGVVVVGMRVRSDRVELPVELSVYDFTLPDELSFWPELNAYRVPKNHIAYYQLAHQHRCVANCWVPRPTLTGKGKDMKVLWDEYDRQFGPLLDGSAFAGNRRSGVPVECMYLPFEDSWPTPLSKETYNYQIDWPGKGDGVEHLVRHMLESPYIGDALSSEYKEAFLAVQRQFVKHFQSKGWTRTEMQCFYGGKKTHRTDFGSNMWWTTDEPYHWDDWLALQFFCRLWTQGRDRLGADPKQWVARADISRPNWQATILDGILDTVYIGGFSSPVTYERCRLLHENTGVKIMAYGGANQDNESNSRSVAMLVSIWLNGANGHLPWQTHGSDRSLDVNDTGTGGAALLVPGERFGLPVVGDMRLKAFREGQQIIEYMNLLAKKRNLTREQVRAMVAHALTIQAGRKEGTSADDADALRFGTLKDWQLAELRRTLAEMITAGPSSRPADSPTAAR